MSVLFPSTIQLFLSSEKAILLVKHNQLSTNASLIILFLLNYLEMEPKRTCFSRHWCEAEQPNKPSRLLLLRHQLTHLPKHMEVHANVNHITLMGRKPLNTSRPYFVNTANSLLHGKSQQETLRPAPVSRDENMDCSSVLTNTSAGWTGFQEISISSLPPIWLWAALEMHV